MNSPSEVKARASKLRELLVGFGCQLKHTESLEVISKLEGYADWNTCSAYLKTLDRVLEGDNAHQIRQQLHDQKLTPIDVTEGSSKTNRAKSTGTFRGGISNNDVAMITRQIATLASSGTPIEEALGAVAKQSDKPNIKSLMLSVRGRVLEGRTLADAMGEFPKVFPQNFLATVAAGEQSGNLDSVLERLADYTEDKQSRNPGNKNSEASPTAPDHSKQPDENKLLYCSFCGKSQHEVRKLIAGPSVFICDECVDLCNDIITEEMKEQDKENKNTDADDLK